MKTTIVCLFAAGMSMLVSGISRDAFGHASSGSVVTAHLAVERTVIEAERATELPEIAAVPPRVESASRIDPAAAARNGNAKKAEPARAPNLRAVRSAVLRHSARFGMIGVLKDASAPAQKDAGAAPLASAPREMWDRAVGDSFAAGGLALSGIGEGSDCNGQGIPLGGIRTGD